MSNHNILDTPRSEQKNNNDNAEESVFVRKFKLYYRLLSRTFQTHLSFPAEVAYLLAGVCYFFLETGVSFDFVLKRKLFRLLARQRILRMFVNWGSVLVLFWSYVAYQRFQRWASIDTSSSSSSPPMLHSVREGSSDASCGEGVSLAERIRKYYKASMSMYRAIGGLMVTLFVRQSMRRIQTDINALIGLDAAATEREMLRFKPPSLWALRAMVGPLKAGLAPPQFLGWENIPQDHAERPLLFVCNHTLMAFDFPFLLYELYRRKKLFIRALADHAHFQIVGNADLLKSFGAVDGTRRNVDLLFEANQSLLVYPGGAREVFKKQSDAPYSLFWEDRMGFARMAVKHGAVIVPVSNYGSESFMKVAADVPLGWVPVPFLFGSDRTFPVPVPSNKTSVDRIFFKFGKPIYTEHLRGKENDETVVAGIKNETQDAVVAGIQELRVVASEFARNRQEKKQERKEAKQQQQLQRSIESKM